MKQSNYSVQVRLCLDGFSPFGSPALAATACQARPKSPTPTCAHAAPRRLAELCLETVDDGLQHAVLRYLCLALCVSFLAGFHELPCRLRGGQSQLKTKHRPAVTQLTQVAMSKPANGSNARGLDLRQRSMPQRPPPFDWRGVVCVAPHFQEARSLPRRKHIGGQI